MNGPDQRGAIGFAERVLELLDEGRYTATYKYAVLLALIDLCLERTQGSGAPPDSLTTRQLAEKILQIYWPHTVPFGSNSVTAPVLRQNTSGQAEIVSSIMTFRERHAPDPSVPHWQSRRAASAAYERLVRRIEWKLIEMPLPRLQMMGQSYAPFIYDIHWDQHLSRQAIEPYLAGRGGTFDNRLLFRPGVGDYLLQLNGLLRPLIQRRWAAMVAQVNRLQDSQLETFLFGADRIRTEKIRAGLWEIQERRCFYCHSRMGDPLQGQVDHFIPWARYPDNGLDNLVVADTACNGAKSSSLAATEHLLRWARRLVPDSMDSGSLAELVSRTGWDRESSRSLSVARAIYCRLPDHAQLWLRRKEFALPDRSGIDAALVIPGS
jgi:5-methylcytosine-specific restriction endonuclease McrA